MLVNDMAEEQTAPGALPENRNGEEGPIFENANLADLPEKLQKACGAAGWTQLTPVQSLAMPYLLAGRDTMVQSRTGSGKTGCYLLPMLEALDPQLKMLQALVLVPTRELALQVEREAQILFGGSDNAACAIYGGVGYRHQLEALKAGCQIAIGTPGRIIDYLLKKQLDFSHIRILIFDEADRMLSIGFYPDIREISSYLPKKRQTAMFSATYPPHVIQLAAEFMQDAVMLSLSRKEVHVAEVEHLFCEVKPMDKDRALVRLLETENPSSAIIFCNTRADVDYLASVLQGFGYNADKLTSDLTQKRRENVLAKVRTGEIKYLVATDVAARGIDIPELSHVFLYDPPEDRESYIHRAGRTGRAGSAGTVISLVDIRQRLDLERIGKFYKINLREIRNPGDEDVAQNVCARLSAMLETRLRSLSGLERIRVNRYLSLARELTAPDGDEEEKISIIAMLLDIFHRQCRNENNYPSRVGAPSSKTAGKKSGRSRSSGRRRGSRDRAAGSKNG